MKQLDQSPLNITDSREQHLLCFSLPSERGTLRTGDYSVKGFEDRIDIERKEINDLVQCLKTGNSERLERELTRGLGLEYFALVIKCNLAHLAEHDYRSMMTPRSVIQSLLTFSVRYWMPVFFCGSRRYAARIVESILQKYIREIEEKNKGTPVLI